MTKSYTHPNMEGLHGFAAFTLGEVQYPRVWWRTVGPDEIAALGFVEYVPAEEEPEPAPLADLKPYQFWAVMRATGHEAGLRAWVASFNDPENEAYDPLAWANASAIIDFSLEYRRDHPLVEAAQQVMGVSVSELDDLWRYAATL